MPNRSKPKKKATVGEVGSFLEWHQLYFPERERAARFEKLRPDPAELASKLADDTFNRVVGQSRTS